MTCRKTQDLPTEWGNTHREGRNGGLAGESDIIQVHSYIFLFALCMNKQKGRFLSVLHAHTRAHAEFLLHHYHPPPSQNTHCAVRGSRQIGGDPSVTKSKNRQPVLPTTDAHTSRRCCKPTTDHRPHWNRSQPHCRSQPTPSTGTSAQRWIYKNTRKVKGRGGVGVGGIK